VEKLTAPKKKTVQNLTSLISNKSLQNVKKENVYMKNLNKKIIKELDNGSYKFCICKTEFA